MTEQDRTHRERTLTGDSITSDKDKGRTRSFTEADKYVEKTNLIKTIGTTQGSQTAPDDNAAAATEKKVVVVGKCQNIES